MKNSASFPRILRQILPDLFILPTVAALLSGIMTWANVGVSEEFMGRWARSFGVSLVLLPMILVGIGQLQKWLDQTLHFVHSLGRKVLASLIIACVIETVLAVGVTAISHPFDAQFAQACLHVRRVHDGLDFSLQTKGNGGRQTGWCRDAEPGTASHPGHHFIQGRYTREGFAAGITADRQ
mgnify:CR=1 FL=1